MEFNNEPYNALLALIAAVKAGERDFLKILELPESRFVEASFDELMANTDDVLSGVNRVQAGFHLSLFDGPTYCLVKYHDNGDVKFIFFITTTDISVITSVSGILVQAFGGGIYDEDKGYPFSRIDKIRLLAAGFSKGEKENLLQTWSFDNTFWLLQYKVDPLQQFSLMVTIHAPKIQDYSIRRKGTILDLIIFDIDLIFQQTEIRREENLENGKIKSVDYLFLLPIAVMDTFDLTTVRIWDDLRGFNRDISTMVTFHASRPISYSKKVEISDRLIRIYGMDNQASGELEMYERDILEESKFYLGRNWHFNEQHGLYNAKNENERNSYWVEVNDMNDDQGFKVSIFSYNQLVNLFSTE